MMSILQMSITAGVLIIAIVIIRSIALNRLPKKMFLVLWVFVLIRLLVPVAIPINIDVSNPVIGSVVEWMWPNSSTYPVVESTAARSLLDSSGIPGASEMPAMLETPEILSILEASEVSTILETPEIPVILETSSVTLGKTFLAPQGSFGIAPTTILWLVGLMVTFLFFAVVCFKNHRTLRFATLIKDNDFVKGWLRSHPHVRPIAIMESDRIKSSFAVGIINPRIILPRSMDRKDKQFLEYVLAHEYVHIKRFDVLWKMLLLLAVCLHWFNPLVWVMLLLANRDLELTCDEAVIRRFGDTTKKAYAHMLIAMAEHQGKFEPLYSSFSKNSIEERIISIAKVKKTSVVSVMLAFVLVAILGCGAFSAVVASDSPTEINQEYNDTLSDVAADSVANDSTTAATGNDVATGSIVNDRTTATTLNDIITSFIGNNSTTTITNTTNTDPTIQALGSVVSQTLQLGEFSGVSAGTVWEVVYRHSESQTVVVKMNESILDYLNVHVQNGTLRAELKGGFSFDFDRGNVPRIYVYAPYLTELNLEGVATAVDWDILYAPEFNIQANGSSRINIDMEVERLSVNSVGASNINLSGNVGAANLTFSGADKAVIDMEVEQLVLNNFGTANIELLGSADTANIVVLGVGRVMAFEMPIRDATIETDGFSRVYVHVLEVLHGAASGGSQIRYKGSPTVTSRTEGGARIEAYQ